MVRAKPVETVTRVKLRQNVALLVVTGLGKHTDEGTDLARNTGALFRRLFAAVSFPLFFSFLIRCSFVSTVVDVLLFHAG